MGMLEKMNELEDVIRGDMLKLKTTMTIRQDSLELLNSIEVTDEWKQEVGYGSLKDDNSPKSIDQSTPTLNSIQNTRGQSLDARLSVNQKDDNLSH